MHMSSATLFLCLIIATCSSLVSAKPTVTCAFKWAESPDDIFIFVKWAHKLDAPAVNNIRDEDVIVNLENDGFSVIADHSTKVMKLDVPLRSKISLGKSTYQKNAFGMNFVLRKEDTQEAWGGLLPSDVVVPKSCHIWWEMKNKYEDALAAVKTQGSSTDWLKTDPYGCEACRLTVTSTLFSPKTLQAISEMTLPEQGTKLSPQSSYNQSLYRLLKSSCNALQVPTRFEDVSKVKIKGSSDGATSWRDTSDTSSESDTSDSSNLREEVYRGCIGLTKVKPSTSKLLSALALVHHALYNNGEVARGTQTGYPKNLIDLVNTPAGREIIRQASHTVCHNDKKASICPVISIPSSECSVCKHIVNDLELKTLRSIPITKSQNQGQDNHHRQQPFLEKELEYVCDEIKWRHFEDNRFDEMCQTIVESKDDLFIQHLREITQSSGGGGHQTTGLSLTNEKSVKDAREVYSRLCGCKEKKKKSPKKKSKEL